jgi:uncharacterized protein YbjT (DUF2867 family)
MKTLVIGWHRYGRKHGCVRPAEEGGLRSGDEPFPDKLKKLPTVVEGFRADLDDPDTLPAAFDGIDSVFLLNAVGPNETDQGLSAVAAAKAAGVRKIVYLSASMPKGSERISHFRSKLPVEKAVKESKIACTLLRPNNFFQNDLRLKSAIMQ